MYGQIKKGKNNICTTCNKRRGLQAELKYRTFANITVAIVVDGAHALEVVQAWVQN